jgi:predicted dehydrogenase
VITSQPLAGHLIDISVPTHAAGIIEFGNGAIATITISFDVAASKISSFEIHGPEASITGPTPPNTTGRCSSAAVPTPMKSRRGPLSRWSTHFTGANRGLGVRDLALAIRGQREPRASGELVLHVLDIMQAIHESADTRAQVSLATRCPRPGAPDLALSSPD